MVFTSKKDRKLDDNEIPHEHSCKSLKVSIDRNKGRNMDKSTIIIG